jgi:Short C-terminal domain
MKKIFFMLLCLVPFIGSAQSVLKEYHASNGKTYRPGDTIKVGLGTMPDGNFKYIQINELLPGPPRRNGNILNAHKDMSGSNYVIKKIKNETEASGTNKIVFTIKTGGLPTYDIWIEEAIASCEVTPCNDHKTGTSPNFSVADELIKLKKLLDDGAITKDEYNTQKKKLLGE